MPFKSNKARILGVDPGTQVLGYSIIEPQGNKIKLLTLGILTLKKTDEHQDKLREIYHQLQDIIESYQPGVMAIEAPFYGKNVQAMLKLGRAQGVSIAAAITMGLEIHEYSPKKIKQSVTGNGNAAKEQVAAMLSHILGIPVQSTHFDATDALACAVCHYQNAGLVLNAVGGKRSSSWKSFVANNADRLKN